jgi:hypothetical protein
VLLTPKSLREFMKKYMSHIILFILCLSSFTHSPDVMAGKKELAKASAPSVSAVSAPKQESKDSQLQGKRKRSESPDELSLLTERVENPAKKPRQNGAIGPLQMEILEDEDTRSKRKLRERLENCAVGEIGENSFVLNPPGDKGSVRIKFNISISVTPKKRIRKEIIRFSFGSPSCLQLECDFLLDVCIVTDLENKPGCQYPQGVLQKGNFLLTIADALVSCYGIGSANVEDSSTIVCQEDQSDVKLDLLKQMTSETGMTWYESKGYLQKNYPAYRDAVMKLREFPLGQLVNALDAMIHAPKVFEKWPNSENFQFIADRMSDWKDLKPIAQIALERNPNVTLSEFLRGVYGEKGENCRNYNRLVKLFFFSGRAEEFNVLRETFPNIGPLLEIVQIKRDTHREITTKTFRLEGSR